VLLFMAYCCPQHVSGLIGQLLAVSLVLLWLLAAAVLTMERPFSPGSHAGYAGNGYYCTWICCCAALVYMVVMVPCATRSLIKMVVYTDGSEKFLFLILACSLVELYHSCYVCGETLECSGMVAWAVVVGFVSSVAASLFLVLPCCSPSLGRFEWYYAMFLLLWWLLGVATLTPTRHYACSQSNPRCNGMFTSSSNGYFASWIALIASTAFVGNLKAACVDLYYPGSTWASHGVVDPDPVHSAPAMGLSPYPGLAPSDAFSQPSRQTKMNHWHTETDM